MNFKQASYLIAIAEEGSITAAARKLYISQPALSQMLAQMEKEYGITVFEHTKPLRLTYAGEACLSAAKKIVEANTSLENKLHEIRREDAGLLRLGLSVQRALQFLPASIALFQKRFPLVRIEFTEAGSATLEQYVADGRVDLALAATDNVNPLLDYQLIEKETIGILAGKDTALAKTHPNLTPLFIRDTANERFIRLAQGHSLRIVQDKLFRENGITPEVLLETDSLEVARRCALHAGACMICSEIFADSYAFEYGSFFPLKDYENHRHFYACTVKETHLPHYAQEYIEIVRTLLQ